MQQFLQYVCMISMPARFVGHTRSGVGNIRHSCQAWHVERFSMARWVNWNTVIMIS